MKKILKEYPNKGLKIVKSVKLEEDDEPVIPPVTAKDRFKKKFSAAPYTIMKAVYADNNKIFLEIYDGKCLMCNQTEDIYEVDDFNICKNCIRTLYKMMTDEEKGLKE